MCDVYFHYYMCNLCIIMCVISIFSIISIIISTIIRVIGVQLYVKLYVKLYVFARMNEILIKRSEETIKINPTKQRKKDRIIQNELKKKLTTTKKKNTIKRNKNGKHC